MADFTIYKTDTGEIISNGSTNADITDILLENGQSIIEGIYEVDEHKIYSKMYLHRMFRF